MKLFLRILSLLAGVYSVWSACNPSVPAGSTFVPVAYCGPTNGTYCSNTPPSAPDGVMHRCHCWGHCGYICDPDPTYASKFRI